MYFLQYFYCYDYVLDFDFVYASILSVFLAAEYSRAIGSGPVNLLATWLMIYWKCIEYGYIPEDNTIIYN